MRRRPLLPLLALATTAPWWSAPARAQARKPLLIDGKKTLYQKVLTRPGASIAAQAGAAGAKALAPFTLFHVYERGSAGGKPWLLVGAGSDGKTDGWLAETDSVPWRHMITLAFASPTSRERVLFFRDRESLVGHVNAADPAGETSKLLKEISTKGTLGAASPVIAAEPDKVVDISKSFYLLPVLEAQSTRLKSGHNTRLVKVASITRDAPPPANAPAPPPASAAAGNEGIANFNSGVVFVIDASSSMQPYIDRTRAAMEEVLRQAEGAKLGTRIRFGVVAFQDDPAKTKGVDYLFKVFADPNQVSTREQFIAALQQVKATPSSTRAYAEDAYAALDAAMSKIAWQRFGGRYVVFITDASAREGNSPLASSKLNTAQMRARAQAQGVALYVMHLKTSEGKNDHAIAEAQYKRLSDWPGRGPLYFPVEAGDPARFEADVKRMANALVEQVKTPQKALQAAAPAPGPAPAAAPAPGDPLQASIDAVGRAMVLAYLGREQGIKAPPMYEAWACDRDVRNREIAAFGVRVLVTKNQLSDLQALVRRLADAYDKTQLDPTSVFEQLRSAAVALGRDASQLAQGKARNLEQAGLMSEFLDGLPYQSPVMSMPLSDWAGMSTGQRQAVIDNLRGLAVLYQRYHDDVDRWVALNPGAADGDKVFPVPIDSLP
ncbi:VWA domain-containing protein [Aquincola sp. S2]|uniref:VWA domain-containing protein n=1 Tax=Pseudaquabacterium terrae TaxID=2732868 RepID=A0ABX2EEP5_9BURK|nr:vWA domain-containing protein [Aquabacterium terrae]NRF67074.1 VWA domain-containing protein [Aquabacterium terrae]